jgi:hypothetical protein
LLLGDEHGRLAMALADTELELRGWLDRLAIQELIFRYSDAMTRADWEQCEAVFAPDAIWEIKAMGIRKEGRRVIGDYLKDQTSAYEVLMQTPHSSVIRLVGSDHAQATTIVHEFMRGTMVSDTGYGESGTPINVEQDGIYFDDVARIEGEWKFTHRLFCPIFVNAGSVTGDVLTERPGLLRPE